MSVDTDVTKKGLSISQEIRDALRESPFSSHTIVSGEGPLGSGHPAPCTETGAWRMASDFWSHWAGHGRD